MIKTYINNHEWLFYNDIIYSPYYKLLYISQFLFAHTQENAHLSYGPNYKKKKNIKKYPSTFKNNKTQTQLII